MEATPEKKAHDSTHGASFINFICTKNSPKFPFHAKVGNYYFFNVKKLGENVLILPQTLDHAYALFLVVEVLHCKKAEVALCYLGNI